MGLTKNKLEYQRTWVKQNSDKISKYRKVWYQKHKKEISFHDLKLRQKNREKIYDILGHKCIRCGFTDKRALQFDHIKGGGSKWVKSKTSRFKISAEFLKLPNIKEEIQILCANCNWIKKFESWEMR